MAVRPIELIDRNGDALKISTAIHSETSDSSLNLINEHGYAYEPIINKRNSLNSTYPLTTNGTSWHEMDSGTYSFSFIELFNFLIGGASGYLDFTVYCWLTNTNEFSPVEARYIITMPKSTARPTPIVKPGIKIKCVSQIKNTHDDYTLDLSSNIIVTVTGIAAGAKLSDNWPTEYLNLLTVMFQSPNTTDTSDIKFVTFKINSYSGSVTPHFKIHKKDLANIKYNQSWTNDVNQNILIDAFKMQFTTNNPTYIVNNNPKFNILFGDIDVSFSHKYNDGPYIARASINGNINVPFFIKESYITVLPLKSENTPVSGFFAGFTGNATGAISSPGIFQSEPGGVTDLFELVVTDTASFMNTAFFYNGAVQSSDIRYKNNIEPVEKLLPKVENLNLIKYNWKDTAEKTIGVSALDLQTESTLDLLVSEKDETLGVDYSKLSVVALKCIQELSEENKELRLRLGSLENKLSEK